MLQSALRQLASTCEDSVLAYGDAVGQAFVLDGLNCTTDSGSLNHTGLVHCPGGSICCKGKCYGRIKAANTRSIVKARCKAGQL